MSAALVGEWSRLLAASLAAAGVEHAVICPGSRSTPFAWALAETPGLACHSLVDERAAAFFALGLGRVTGRPAVVLSTSGTAAANFFPAVVEAALARVPLLVLTADRPLELQAAEAAQTIDQVKLYGDHVRRFFDLGAPDPSPSALAGVPRLAVQAVQATLEPEPGPVQLNARARKPLEPGPAETEAERRVAASVAALVERGVTRVTVAERGLAEGAARDLGTALVRAKRGLMVCGPLPAGADDARRALVSLSERLALPLFTEATSGLRFGAEPTALTADALDWLLRSAATRRALAPDVIVRVGGTPTCASLEALLGEHPQAALHVVSEHGHPDAGGRARTLTTGPLASTLGAVTRALGAAEPNGEQRAFAERVRAANADAWKTVDAALGAAPPDAEPKLVRAVVEALPPGGLLAVGNSLPVRLLDTFVPAAARRLRVVSQRGANGIDGLVAGAAGAALAAGTKALLLVGDVSFQHDLGGLAAARLVSSPLVLCVIDNGGGRIFDQLPVAKLYDGRPERAELWLTPPRLALEHAGPLFGIPYVAASNGDELRRALDRAFAHPGATLVHVRVGPRSVQAATHTILTELDRSPPFR